MFRITGITTVLALVVAATGCVSTPQQELTLQQKLEKQHFAVLGPVDRVQDYGISGWNSIDSKHVVIHSGPSRYYLVTLRNSCHNLSTAHAIAFSTTLTSLTRFDKLLVRDNTGGMLERCLIADLHQLTKIKTAKADDRKS